MQSPSIISSGPRDVRFSQTADDFLKINSRVLSAKIQKNSVVLLRRKPAAMEKDQFSVVSTPTERWTARHR